MNLFVSAVCRNESYLTYLTQQLAIELEIRHIGKDADVSQKRGWIRSESAREARITQSAGCGWCRIYEPSQTLIKIYARIRESVPKVIADPFATTGASDDSSGQQQLFEQ